MSTNRQAVMFFVLALVAMLSSSVVSAETYARMPQHVRAEIKAQVTKQVTMDDVRFALEEGWNKSPRIPSEPSDRVSFENIYNLAKGVSPLCADDSA